MRRGPAAEPVSEKLGALQVLLQEIQAQTELLKELMLLVKKALGYFFLCACL